MTLAELLAGSKPGITQAFSPSHGTSIADLAHVTSDKTNKYNTNIAAEDYCMMTAST